MQTADAVVSGMLFVTAFGLLVGCGGITGLRTRDVIATIVMAGLAIEPYRVGLLDSVLVGIGLLWIWRKRRARTGPALA